MRRIGVHGAGMVPISDMGTAAGAVVLPWYLLGGAPMPDLVADAALAPDYATSLVNLVPGLDVAEINAPTWALDGHGWKFDGIADALDTQIVPDATTCYLVQFDNVTWGGWTRLYGVWDSVNNCGTSLVPAVGGNHWAYWGVGGFQVSAVPELVSGVFGVQGAIQAWLDAVPYGDYTVWGPGWANITRTMYIGCRNWDGVAGEFRECHVKRLVVWKTNVPTAIQIAAVSAAMMAM